MCFLGTGIVVFNSCPSCLLFKVLTEYLTMCSLHTHDSHTAWHMLNTPFLSNTLMNKSQKPKAFLKHRNLSVLYLAPPLKPFRFCLTDLKPAPGMLRRVCVQTCDAISWTHMWLLSMNNLDEYCIEFQPQTPRHRRYILWLVKMSWGSTVYSPVSKHDCI